MGDEIIPHGHIITVNGISVYVSKREFERVQRYGYRHAKLESDWRDYVNWLVVYRLKHPHKRREEKDGGV